MAFQKAAIGIFMFPSLSVFPKKFSELKVVLFQRVLQEAEIKHGHDHETGTNICLQLSSYFSITLLSFSPSLRDVSSQLLVQSDFYQNKSLLFRLIPFFSVISLSPLTLKQDSVVSLAFFFPYNCICVFGPHPSSHCLARLSNQDSSVPRISDQFSYSSLNSASV